MCRPSGGAYRGRVERAKTQRPIPPIYGEPHVIRTLHTPNRRWRTGALYCGPDGDLRGAQQVHTIDALVQVTLPVVRFGRDPAEIFPTTEVRL